MATTTPTSTAAVAQELVTMCRAGRNMDAVNKLYSPNIVSIEPVGTETMPARMSGLDAICGKNEWWFANNEVHNVKVKGRVVGEDQFVAGYAFETTFRPTGQRSEMRELALYTVKDG